MTTFKFQAIVEDTSDMVDIIEDTLDSLDITANIKTTKLDNNKVQFEFPVDVMDAKVFFKGMQRYITEVIQTPVDIIIDDCKLNKLEQLTEIADHITFVNIDLNKEVPDQTVTAKHGGLNWSTQPVIDFLTTKANSKSIPEPHIKFGKHSSIDSVIIPFKIKADSIAIDKLKTEAQEYYFNYILNTRRQFTKLSTKSKSKSHSNKVYSTSRSQFRNEHTPLESMEELIKDNGKMTTIFNEIVKCESI